MSKNESPNTEYPEDCAEVLHVLRTLKPSVSPQLELQMMFEVGRVEGNASARRDHSRWSERVGYAFAGILVGSLTMLLIPQFVNGSTHQGEQETVAIQRAPAMRSTDGDLDLVLSYGSLPPNEVRFIRVNVDARREELANTGAIAVEFERLKELAGPELVGPSEVFNYSNFQQLLVLGG